MDEFKGVERTGLGGIISLGGDTPTGKMVGAGVMAKGITFDEVMAGPFALDVSDPREGRDKGEREGSKLSLNASVSIPDLDAFIADPKHLGGLSGSVDFPPLGKGLRVSKTKKG